MALTDRKRKVADSGPDLLPPNDEAFGGLPDAPSVSTSLRELRRAVSYRRFLLDAHLTWAAPLMRGDIVDLGGKRARRRGGFIPPEHVGTRWIYVNIDPETSPDLLCDVAAVPLPDANADVVVCTEVLEHLPDPAACVREGNRLLRRDGCFVASVPFLYPVHADPEDYQRFTIHGLRRLFRGFSRVHIREMGGSLGVIGMFLEQGARRMDPSRMPTKLLRRILFETGRLLEWNELRHSHVDGSATASGLTTGYFLIAQK